MGDRDHGHLKSLLASKNAEIERLNAEILAHSARASNLHTRLLQAFDTLDESQRSHARELGDVENKYVRLDRRFRKQTNALKTCAAEKDDLKESVLELVEKVEQSNDIRSWPFNRLQLTRFAESPRQLEPIARHSIDQEQLSYAGAIIDRLRRERDEERVGHVLTREVLQSRIDTLEAQLARREAELEYCATHTTHPPLVLSGRNDANVGSSSYGGTTDPNPPARTGSSLKGVDPGEPENGSTAVHAMTNEEIIKMLDMTAARNRALEVEIKTLFKRLEQARSIPFSPVAASPSKPSPQFQPSRRITVSRSRSQRSNGPGSTASTRNSDNRNSERRVRDECDVDGDGDPVDDDQQRRSRTHTPRNRGPSRTQIRTSTPSGQLLRQYSRSNRHSPKAKNVRGSRVSAHETDEESDWNQDQGPGFSVRPYQSASTPLSDSIDDDHSVHDYSDDDGVDVVADWRTSLSALGSPDMGARASGVLPSQEHVSPGLGPHNASGLDDASDLSSLDLRVTEIHNPRPKSAIIAGLDAQLEELSTQIDGFRQERENLLKMVAEQRQHRQSQHPGWEGASLGSHSRMVPRGNDDQSVGGVRAEEGAVKDKQDPSVEHGDDQDGDVHTDRAEKDAFDTLAHRLSVVEEDCLRLRHELEECRATTETRENELLAEIQVLQRRVEELSMPCRPASTTAPFLSNETDVASAFSPSGRRQNQNPEQEQLFIPEGDTLSVFDPTPALIPDTTTDDDLHTSHLRFRDKVSEPENLVTETYPLPHSPSSHIQPEIDIVQSSSALGSEDSSIRPNPQIPWLRLEDSELDGLLDAIDGEASMELATPLMPTSLLERDSSDGLPVDHDQISLDDGDRGDQSEDMIIEGMSEIQGGGVENSGYEEERENYDHEYVNEENGGERVITEDAGMERDEQFGLKEDDDDDGDDLIPDPSLLTNASLRREGNDEERSGHDDRGGGVDDTNGRHNNSIERQQEQYHQYYEQDHHFHQRYLEGEEEEEEEVTVLMKS